MISAPHSIISFLFLGMLLQICLLLRPNRSDLATLGLCIILPFTAFLPTWHEVNHEVHYVWPLHAGLAVFALFGIVAMQFHDRLLPRLYEGTVLVWNCIFLYALISAFGAHTNLVYAAVGLSAVVTIMIVLPIRLNFAAKIFVYAWFLLMICSITALQFRFIDFGVFFENSTTISSSTAILDGMAFIFLGIHALYLFMLLPIPGRGQSIESRIEEWQAEATAMVARFQDAQVTPLVATLIPSAFGAIFYWNRVTQTLAPGVLINLLLVSMPIYLGFFPPLLRRLRGETDFNEFPNALVNTNEGSILQPPILDRQASDAPMKLHAGRAVAHKKIRRPTTDSSTRPDS